MSLRHVVKSQKCSGFPLVDKTKALCEASMRRVIKLDFINFFKVSRPVLRNQHLPFILQIIDPFCKLFFLIEGEWRLFVSLKGTDQSVTYTNTIGGPV